jgi:transposase
VSHPFPDQWITHGILSIPLTNLMNVNRFHVSCSQESDYRLHFACCRLLNFLKHRKHTGRCVNAFWLPAKASVPSQRINKLCTHARHRVVQWQYLQMDLIYGYAS